MNKKRTDDEILLIAFLAGKCTARERETVAKRIESDEDFQRLHENLSNASDAINLLPEPAPPDDLVEKTMQRINSARTTQALLVRQEMMSHGARRSTFSFTELITAAAAIILLGIFIVPSVNLARKRNQQNACLAQAGEIGSALQSFASDHNGLLPRAGTSQRWMRDSAASPTAEPNNDATSNSAALYKLIQQKYASPITFQCPSHSTDSFEHSDGMTDFPSGRHIGYSFHHSLGQNGISLRQRMAGAMKKIKKMERMKTMERMVILADANPIFVSGKFRPERVSASLSQNHDHGQTVLFLDMHVEWVTHSNVGINGNNIFLVDEVTEYHGTECPASQTDTFLLPAFVPAN